MSTPNLALAFNLPPEKAVKYFESKGMAITWGWREMEAAAHARAFTVAGVTKLDVLQDIRDALQRALNEGQTYAQFKDGLIPLLQQKGWWGKLAQTDMETGEMAGKGLTPRRLGTIFRTNIQSSYMAGRYKAHVENVGDRPWWQYVAIMDSRTRPQHSALNGRTFRYDDPFWQKFYPPNGFNCRCRVRAFTDAEVRKRGIATSISGKALERIELPDPFRPGQTLPRTRFEYAPGKYIASDIGWEGNPGRDADLAEWAARKLAGVDADLGAAAWASLGPASLTARAREFALWADALEHPRGELKAVGALSEAAVAGLSERGRMPASALLEVRDEDVFHVHRESKLDRLPWEWYRDLPLHVAAPKALLYDKTDPAGALLMVFDIEGETAKLVVKIDYEVVVRGADRIKRPKKANVVRSGKFVPAASLRDGTAYDVIEGAL